MTTETKSSIKPTLGDFTVEHLGVHHPDFFNGYGVAFDKEYTGCAYGIGDTEAVALEDCLEMMAQSCPIDFDDKVEKRIRDEYGRADDNVTALDEVNVTALDDYPDKKCPECGNDISDVEFGDNCAECGKEFDYPEYVPYFHIGIKWNIREEQRIERIRNLPNVQPTRYEDYSPIDPHNCHAGLRSWGYARRADGSASYGDFHDDDWPESAEAYFGTLCEDITETGELYFYVPCASGSDYSGSTVESANAKCVEDEFGEHEWVHPVYGDHGTYAIAIGLTGLLTCDDDTFDELCEVIEGLADYPVIDEDKLHEVEAENTDEAWNSWVRGDFVRALEKECGDDYDFEWPNDPEFRMFFEGQCEKANTYWYCERSGSDMYVAIDDVVKEMSFDDYSKWAIRYEVSWCNGGENTAVYYDESDAIEQVDTLRASGNSGASYKVLPAVTDGETGETGETEETVA